jgi:tRNA threonylcarbamoyladenosine biosynthesis protein TsaE
MPILLSHNEPETLAIGRAIGAALRPGDVVAIDGPLGAGKTRLVRGIALGMGFEGSVVSSPTYVIVNEYLRPADETDFRHTPRRLFHVDAYRLSSAEDLDSLGWDRVMSSDSDAAVAIEWADRITGGEGGLIDLHKLAASDPERLGPEPGLCRVRMELVGPIDESAPSDDQPPPGLRRITLDPPGVWRARPGDGWRDLARLAAILPDAPSAIPTDTRLPLPRTWARCAITGRAVPPDSPTFPFADERARLADLGRWISGAYTISREIRPEDESDIEFGPPGRGV